MPTISWAIDSTFDENFGPCTITRITRIGTPDVGVNQFCWVEYQFKYNGSVTGGFSSDLANMLVPPAAPITWSQQGADDIQTSGIIRKVTRTYIGIGQSGSGYLVLIFQFLQLNVGTVPIPNWEPRGGLQVSLAFHQP